jgi:hypothetical protein
MHVGVFVHAKGKVVADGQREIDLANGIGGHVHREDDPAGEKKPNRDRSRGQNPRLRF